MKGLMDTAKYLGNNNNNNNRFSGRESKPGRSEHESVTLNSDSKLWSVSCFSFGSVVDS
jgi:hypothetical protein